MNEVIFLKLGGSLITDKRGVEAVRQDVLARLATEIAAAFAQKPDLQLVLGHGSGSFGHVAAAKYGTRQGVKTTDQWRGFTEVSAAALRLNTFVVEALQQAGVPAMRLQPAASVQCTDGFITKIAVQPIRAALAAGLLPVVHGDVAFDTVRGGTIVSTEEVLGAMAEALAPSWLLLAGETDGVYDTAGQTIPKITMEMLPELRAALNGSHGTDVTGGMVSKVTGMVQLVAQMPGLQVRIFNGLQAEALTTLLCEPAAKLGTMIR